MSDFQKWSSTHQTVRAENDWNELLDHGLVKPASFIIDKVGTIYRAINGSTGKLLISGENAVAVILTVFGDLTVGRTWKEKVVIKGDITLISRLDIPSYTILEAHGKLTLQGSGAQPNKIGLTLDDSSELIFDTITQSDGANINILITSAGPKSVHYDIVIKGNLIDGNYANQDYPSTGDRHNDYCGTGISTYGARWNIQVDKIMNCGQYGGLVHHAGYSYINVPYINNVDQYDVAAYPERVKYASGIMLTYYTCVKNKVFVGVDTVDGSGVFLEDKANDNYVVCYVKNTGVDDGTLRNMGGVAVESSNNNEIHMIVEDSGQNGLFIWKSVSDAAYTARYNRVYGIVRNSGYCGLEMAGGQDNIIAVAFIDSAQAEKAGYDTSIRLEAGGGANCLRNDFSQCKLETDGKVDYHIETIDVNQDYNIFAGVRLLGTPKTNQVRLLGKNDILKQISAPFVMGDGGATEHDKGWLINATGEEAKTFLKIPVDWQEGVLFLVDASSAVTEIHKMELACYGYAAADNEPENTHDISSSFYSSSANFTADDVILFSYSGSTILLPQAKDSVRFKVDWKDVLGDNCATNAYFRTLTLKYV